MQDCHYIAVLAGLALRLTVQSANPGQYFPSPSYTQIPLESLIPTLQHL